MDDERKEGSDDIKQTTCALGQGAPGRRYAVLYHIFTTLSRLVVPKTLPEPNSSDASAPYLTGVRS
jgi:hypothetical protein